MKKKIIIFGSTGSIGSTTLETIKTNKNFTIELLTTNKNAKKILKQALKYKVKNIIISDREIYNKYKTIFLKKKINLIFGFNNINKFLKYKIDFCVNAITGIDGLEPALKIIPHTKKLLIANKESIICGWHLISKSLKVNNTKFIPLDSEHFSIWKLIKNEKINNINNIILTASGGPFLNKKRSEVINAKPYKALKHPKWKMGKKITIDSATMMNKVFEYIEALKIFNLNKKKLSILIHPESFIHAIVFFKGELIKFLAHDTNMRIPILNALEIDDKISQKNYLYFLKNLNNISFRKPSSNKFPLLKLINIIPKKNSYFETILITLNDQLVEKYLLGEINFNSINQNILKMVKKPFFKKYYKLKPKNIYDIKKMIKITKIYLNSNIINYEK